MGRLLGISMRSWWLHDSKIAGHYKLFVHSETAEIKKKRSLWIVNFKHEPLWNRILVEVWAK